MRTQTKSFSKTIKSLLSLTFLALFVSPFLNAQNLLAQKIKKTKVKTYPTFYKTLKVEGQEIFYREAGPEKAPTIILLHGFPTSSHMFRNLIPALSNHYHVIAPDYPGFGNSSMPTLHEFDYSFDHLAEIIEKFLQQKSIQKYSLYLMDYGAPIGFRIAAKNPKKIEALVIQNGNAYQEGLQEFWKPIKKFWKEKSKENATALQNSLLTLAATKWQYTVGTRNQEKISPDNWIIDQSKLERPGNKEIQIELFYSYKTNLPLYPQWQKYFRLHQPPTLIVWGKKDPIFPEAGAHPYKRDLKNIEFHLLNTGHFALEEDGELIATLILNFMKNKNLPSK